MSGSAGVSAPASAEPGDGAAGSRSPRRLTRRIAARLPAGVRRALAALRHPPATRLDALEAGGGSVVVRGLAYIQDFPVAAPRRRRVVVRAVPAGARPHGRLRARSRRLATAPSHRPDANHRVDHPAGDIA